MIKDLLKGWLMTIPSFEEKVKTINELTECLIMIGKTFTEEQRNKLERTKFL